jgi:hypothetical protein
MALLLQESVVYHPGRTGGHWVKARLRQAGLVQGESAGLHDNPEDLRHWPERAARPWSIAFVRHPLSWMRSFWVHETHFGWTNDLLCPPDEFATFAEYLDYLIETFPGGAVKRYFAPFIDNVNLIGKFEGLRAELLRLLKEAGENVPELPEGRIINRSADDIVSACAKAPRAILERFLANEAEYCSRFGYDRLPEECLDDNPECQRKWFPILPSRGGAAAENSKPAPESTFLFSDGTLWRGRPEQRRWQLAIWDALVRSSRTQKGGVLELGCGDGFFVFLAEELGYVPCRGVHMYRRYATSAAAARLGSKAQFIEAPMFARLGGGLATTILMRGVLNHTPWPHIPLLYAKQMLAEGGEIIIGSVIIEMEPDPGLCFSNLSDTPLFPRSCPMIMSRMFLLNLVSQCGLAVDEICSEYDEIIEPQKYKLLEGLAKVLHSPPEGLLRRVVCRLRAAGGRTDSPELRFWLHSEPLWLADCSSVNLNEAARHVIDRLTAENKQLKSDVQLLELALHDREADLQRERVDAAVRSAELVDRTNRLERALTELNSFRP